MDAPAFRSPICPGHFMHRQVVHHDNIVGYQGRNKKLLDILDEELTVHGTVNDQRRGDP